MEGFYVGQLDSLVCVVRASPGGQCAAFYTHFYIFFPSFLAPPPAWRGRSGRFGRNKCPSENLFKIDFYLAVNKSESDRVCSEGKWVGREGGE